MPQKEIQSNVHNKELCYWDFQHPDTTKHSDTNKFIYIDPLESIRALMSAFVSRKKCIGSVHCNPILNS